MRRATRRLIPRDKQIRARRARERQERIVRLLRGRVMAGDDLACICLTSKRTIYRDIEEMRDLGADIPGVAGLGFILRATWQEVAARSRVADAARAAIARAEGRPND